MEKALGLVEVKGLSSAVEAADVMVKAANVTLVELEAARGSGMMTVKVNGDVGAVRAAVEAGRASAMADGSLVSVDIIARPNEDTARVFVRNTAPKQRPNFYGQTETKAAAPDEVKEEVQKAALDTPAPAAAKEEIHETAPDTPLVPEETAHETASDAAADTAVSEGNKGAAKKVSPSQNADGVHEAQPVAAKKPARRTRRTRNTKKAKTSKTTSKITPDVSDTDTNSHT